jgi:RNA 3'-terminal phosphate cyclase (ATP)
MERIMIDIDGSTGEGGGQILRTSLSLSMITGIPFTIENIRSKRKNPGLQRQHLTSVGAAKTVCNARVEGSTPGSLKLTFIPGKIVCGEYNFNVGTAGSSSLILQTILPALLFCNGRSNIVLEGGTHNPFAPPFEFLKQSFGRILNSMGYDISMEIESYGFYPAGGGKISVDIKPSGKIKKLQLTERGRLVGKRAFAISANIPDNVNLKEVELLKGRLGTEDLKISPVRVKSP